MAKPTLDLNLDALRAVQAEATDRRFRFKLDNYEFELPSQLPLDVLGPLMPKIPKIIELLKPMLSAAVIPGQAQTSLDDIDMSGTVDALIADPMLPMDVIDAFLEAGHRLFEDDQWTRFKQARPTMPEARALLAALWSFYGLSLGELSRSAESSAPAGQTSKPTSKGGTTSTRGTSGAKRQTRASKAAVGS